MSDGCPKCGGFEWKMRYPPICCGCGYSPPGEAFPRGTRFVALPLDEQVMIVATERRELTLHGSTRWVEPPADAKDWEPPDTMPPMRPPRAFFTVDPRLIHEEVMRSIVPPLPPLRFLAGELEEDHLSDAMHRIWAGLPEGERVRILGAAALTPHEEVALARGAEPLDSASTHRLR